MDYLIIFAIAFYLGWQGREVQAKMRIKHYIEEMKMDIIDDVKKDIINITIDFADTGDIFIYKKEDGTYLGHGKSMKELEDVLLEKFPGKLFNASPEDLAKLEAR